MDLYMPRQAWQREFLPYFRLLVRSMLSAPRAEFFKINFTLQRFFFAGIIIDSFAHRAPEPD